MLARLLTTPFRLVRSYREELCIVAVGLLYNAGVSGAIARAVHHEPGAPVAIEVAAAPEVAWSMPGTPVVAPIAPIAPAVTQAAAERAEVMVRVRTAEARAVARRVRDSLFLAERLRRVGPLRAAPGGDAPENIAAAFEARALTPAMIEEMQAAVAAARPGAEEARIRAAIVRAMAAQAALQANEQGS